MDYWLNELKKLEGNGYKVMDNAGIMMENTLAIRSYTVKKINPLLTDRIQQEIILQTVLAYTTTQNIKLHQYEPTRQTPG